jgi:hypothetical protein
VSPGQASWSASISKRALVVQYPTSRQAQPEPNLGDYKYVSCNVGVPSLTESLDSIYQKVLASLPRFLLILDYQVIALLLSYIPIIGKPLAFSYACLLNSYYCFESVDASRKHRQAAEPLLHHQFQLFYTWMESKNSHKAHATKDSLFRRLW